MADSQQQGRYPWRGGVLIRRKKRRKNSSSGWRKSSSGNTTSFLRSFASSAIDRSKSRNRQS